MSERRQRVSQQRGVRANIRERRDVAWLAFASQRAAQYGGRRARYVPDRHLFGLRDTHYTLVTCTR